MKRGLWIAAAVWVVFWSLYPTFSRPRAFYQAIRAGARAQNECDSHPGAGQHKCYLQSQKLLQEELAPITLRSEYAGYGPVWLGVGVGVPCACALALLAMRRRRLA